MTKKSKSRIGEYRSAQRLLKQYKKAFESGEYEKARQIAIKAKNKHGVDLESMYNEKAGKSYGEKKDNTVVYE